MSAAAWILLGLWSVLVYCLCDLLRPGIARAWRRPKITAPTPPAAEPVEGATALGSDRG